MRSLVVLAEQEESVHSHSQSQLQLRWDSFGRSNRDALAALALLLEEDILVVVRDEKLLQVLLHRCLGIPEEGAEALHTHNNDNSNHNIAANNGSGEPGYTNGYALGVREEEDQEEQDVLGDQELPGDYVFEENRMAYCWEHFSWKPMLDQQLLSPLVASSRRAAD
mmetsp:Transcript_28302/g.59287  ORF Transcript_28302/g.59287 Transcript_28302/m.59287 type:complete len:166 (+) Transcript_28302:3402-3899(+)